MCVKFPKGQQSSPSLHESAAWKTALVLIMAAMQRLLLQRCVLDVFIIPCSKLYWYKIGLFPFLSPNQSEIPG